MLPWRVLALVLVLLMLPACPADGAVTSGYGLRVHPLTGLRSMHRGIDLAAPRGSPIRSAWPGVVEHVGRSKTWGRNVVVRTGPFAVRYAHAHTVEVEEGDAVARGAQIGTVGATGRATGPHLHLEVARGRRRLRPDFLLATCQAARVR